MKSLILPEAIVYPKYEVTIPSLPNETIFVTSFTVKDLLEIASVVNFSESKLVEHIINMVYKKIVDKSKLKVESEEEFMKKYYVPDRDALLLGIIVATYNTEFDMNLRCTNCKAVNKFKVDILKHVTFNKDVYKPNLNEEIYLETSKVKMTITYPTLYETLDLIRKMENKVFRNKDEREIFMSVVGNIVPFISKMVVLKADGTEIVDETDNKLEIADYISVLPKKDYDKLVEKIISLNITNPYITFNFRYQCNECGSSNTATGDVNTLFFQMI